MDKLLLHTCCGVCGICVLEQLACQFEVTAYFYNPNIQPIDEYNRRLQAVKAILNPPQSPFAKGGGLNSPQSPFAKGGGLNPPQSPFAKGGGKGDLIEGEYIPKEWFSYLAEKCDFDYKNEPESGRRCQACFEMRLERTARFAKEKGFTWFATTLTMGRNKKAEVINEIGKKLAQKYSLKFYEADWKKKGGAIEAHCRAKEKNLYRQNYCGCVFSYFLKKFERKR